MLVTFLKDNFGLPSGGLYANLIASAFLGTAAFLYGRVFEKRSIKRHEEDMALKRTHHQQQMATLNKIHNLVGGES